MNEKQIFIHQLKKKLANLPEKERKKSLSSKTEPIRICINIKKDERNMAVQVC